MLPRTCKLLFVERKLPAHPHGTALDHALPGIGAGTVTVFCMNPLDLLKVKFQLSKRRLKDDIGRGMIHVSEGGGLGPNVAVRGINAPTPTVMLSPRPCADPSTSQEEVWLSFRLYTGDIEVGL